MRAQVRDISRKHAIAMKRSVRKTILTCLREDFMHPAIRAVLKRHPELAKQYLEACQVFNALSASADEKGPDEVAPISKT